jgi:hypothetical protein
VPGRDDVHWHAAGQHKADAGIAQALEVDAAQAGALTQALELVGVALMADGGAVLAYRDQTVIGPASGRGLFDVQWASVRSPRRCLVQAVQSRRFRSRHEGLCSWKVLRPWCPGQQRGSAVGCSRRELGGANPSGECCISAVARWSRESTGAIPASGGHLWVPMTWLRRPTTAILKWRGYCENIGRRYWSNTLS